jgi:hypothetical protein
MESEVREIRGVPLWLMQEYLLEMGGTLIEDGLVEGDGWTVRLTKLDPFVLGSLSVGQIRVEMSGDPEGFANLKVMIEPKLLRGGG